MKSYADLVEFHKNNHGKPMKVDENGRVIFVEYRSSLNVVFVWASKPHRYSRTTQGNKEIWSVELEKVFCVNQNNVFQDVTQKVISSFGPAAMDGVVGVEFIVYPPVNGVHSQRFTSSANSKVFKKGTFDKARQMF